MVKTVKDEFVKLGYDFVETDTIIRYTKIKKVEIKDDLKEQLGYDILVHRECIYFEKDSDVVSIIPELIYMKKNNEVVKELPFSFNGNAYLYDLINKQIKEINDK